MHKSSCCRWLYSLYANKNKMHSPVNVIFSIPSKKLWKGLANSRGHCPTNKSPWGAKPGAGCEAMLTLSWEQPEGSSPWWGTIKINPSRSQYWGVGDPHQEHHICLRKDLNMLLTHHNPPSWGRFHCKLQDAKRRWKGKIQEELFGITICTTFLLRFFWVALLDY